MVISRKQVFEKLMNLNLLSKVNLEVGRVRDIVKILDAGCCFYCDKCYTLS